MVPWSGDHGGFGAKRKGHQEGQLKSVVVLGVAKMILGWLAACGKAQRCGNNKQHQTSPTKPDRRKILLETDVQYVLHCMCIMMV